MSGEESLGRLDVEKLDEFEGVQVTYVGTEPVKEGVECDTYVFNEDDSRDLAIVKVTAGSKTPLQKILHGSVTIEGFVSGIGTLTVTSEDGEAVVYIFDGTKPAEPVTVEVGQTMQWEAAADISLVFYEVCFPPYQDGRFKDLEI